MCESEVFNTEEKPVQDIYWTGGTIMIILNGLLCHGKITLASHRGGLILVACNAGKMKFLIGHTGPVRRNFSLDKKMKLITTLYHDILKSNMGIREIGDRAGI
jgi:hypothetical protein